MKRDAPAQRLTPLERLQLRDALQDRWREQVRQITLLSLARYERDDADGAALPDGVRLEGGTLDRSIHRARARLENLEQAMHRLDDRSYGRCVRCGGPIAFTRLAETPEEMNCDDCASAAAALSSRSTNASVA